jgi:hypothetical protein
MPQTKHNMPLQPEKSFPSFREFMDSLSASKLEHFKPLTDSKVASDDAFLEMKNHLLRHYQGVEVSHSFADENGQIFDCIPIGQQPSLKGTQHKVAVPPEIPSPGGHHGEMAVQPQLRPDRKDKYGNAMWCPPGTIAKRRVTLEELSRFESLRHFFQKTPLGGRHPRLSAPNVVPGIPAGVHKYAHAYTNVDNLGGGNFVNVWSPNVGSQIFSLSQHWYAGGSPVQTAEVGWQVYPQKYGTTQPCLFIYWTADGYQNTGCYNLDCSAFVQTNKSWILGGTLSPVSTPNGPQYELNIYYYLYKGNWWLYLGGGAASNAIGYYPASQYGTGPLASHATDIDFGGEVVDTTAWPPMGSGAFASSGWQKAAYQRAIEYFPTSGGAVSAKLTPQQPSPACFTINVYSTSAPWSEYFFFGGPGGNNC